MTGINNSELEVHESDSLFHAIAEALNSQGLCGGKHTVKSLRLLCKNYAVRLRNQCSNDTALREWGEAVLAESSQEVSLDDYIDRIEFTAEEALAAGRSPLPGQHVIDGRIISVVLDIEINFYAGEIENKKTSKLMNIDGGNVTKTDIFNTLNYAGATRYEKCEITLAMDADEPATSPRRTHRSRYQVGPITLMNPGTRRQLLFRDPPTNNRPTVAETYSNDESNAAVMELERLNAATTLVGLLNTPNHNGSDSMEIEEASIQGLLMMSRVVANMERLTQSSPLNALLHACTL